MKSSSKQLISLNEVGVLLLGYNRPTLLRNRLTELAAQGVKNLYISIDGGVSSKTSEMENAKKFAVNKFSHIDRFQLDHNKKNLGVDLHTYKKVTEILKFHEYIIVIEDDIQLSKNFIVNLLNGLSILKMNNKPGVVSSWSPLSCKRLNNRWRLSSYSFTWGWACSREVWKDFHFDLNGENIFSNMGNSMKWKNFSDLQKKQWESKFRNVRNYKWIPWDIQFFNYGLKNDLVFLAPIYTFSGNEGFGSSKSTHTKGSKPFILSIAKLNNGKVVGISKFVYKACHFLDKYYMNDLKIIQRLKSKDL